MTVKRSSPVAVFKSMVLRVIPFETMLTVSPFVFLTSTIQMTDAIAIRASSAVMIIGAYLLADFLFDITLILSRLDE